MREDLRLCCFASTGTQRSGGVSGSLLSAGSRVGHRNRESAGSGKVVSAAIINQGLVRFLDMKPGASEEDHDRRTDQVIARIVSDGEAFFGGTTWRGRRAMRISVCSCKPRKKMWRE